MNEAPKKAVILIGHGSRAAGADDDMDRVAQGLRKATDGIVEVCRMGGRGIPFAPVFEQCVRQGAQTVMVIPYFLHFGVHLRQDIPELLREAAQAHPGVRLILGRHLGYDESLVALVEKRIGESEALCDVRDLAETPIDRNPEIFPARRSGEPRIREHQSSVGSLNGTGDRIIKGVKR